MDISNRTKFKKKRKNKKVYPLLLRYDLLLEIKKQSSKQIKFQPNLIK